MSICQGVRNNQVALCWPVLYPLPVCIEKTLVASLLIFLGSLFYCWGKEGHNGGISAFGTGGGMMAGHVGLFRCEFPTAASAGPVRTFSHQLSVCHIPQFTRVNHPVGQLCDSHPVQGYIHMIHVGLSLCKGVPSDSCCSGSLTDSASLHAMSGKRAMAPLPVCPTIPSCWNGPFGLLV